MDQAIELIKTGQATCVAARNGAIIHTASGFGVSPLLALYQNSPEILKGASIYDRIVGKAAAALITLGGAASAYGEIMSADAVSYLKSHGIELTYGTLVDEIKNRAGDDMCPFEKSVKDVDDPGECYEQIVKTVSELMASN